LPQHCVKGRFVRRATDEDGGVAKADFDLAGAGNNGNRPKSRGRNRRSVNDMNRNQRRRLAFVPGDEIVAAPSVPAGWC
jgi:hypothetical protein